MKLDKIQLDDIKPAEYNPRTIRPEVYESLKNSIKKWGLASPIVIDLTDNNTIIGGHQRYQILRDLAGSDVDYENKKLNLLKLGDIGFVFDDEVKIKDKNHQKALNIAFNKYSGEWDNDKLNELLLDLETAHFDMELTGFTELELFPVEEQLLTLQDDDDIEISEEVQNVVEGNVNEVKDKYHKGSLTQYGKKIKERFRNDVQFVIPPFTVFNQKNWQLLKQKYLDEIQESGLSRQDGASKEIGVSLVDPVLIDFLLTSFLPATNNTPRIVDPTAGDQALGYISSKKGYVFTGIEIREEQCLLNNKKVEKFHTGSTYICDDGENILKYVPETSQDLLITCPPYFDLEKYSDKENDLSNQESYAEFIFKYEKIIMNAISTVKDNRFIIFIVGDIRNKKSGEYYGFPHDIVRIGMKYGLKLYNEAILSETGASSALRMFKNFRNRKLTKTHQNIIIFYKGEPKTIQSNFLPKPHEFLHTLNV